jgi:hypothetical protein
MVRFFVFVIFVFLPFSDILHNNVNLRPFVHFREELQARYAIIRIRTGMTKEEVDQIVSPNEINAIFRYGKMHYDVFYFNYKLSISFNDKNVVIGKNL